MKTFKSFLQEAKAEGSPEQVFVRLQPNPTAYYLDKYCPDLFWMLAENTPFYRGMRTELSGISYVDLTKTTRKSQNTSNWYTEIFDNHFEMGDYPKRSKSLICSSDLEYAYGFGKQVNIVLPVKNSKIGEVRELDIWDLGPIELFGRSGTLDDLNDFLGEIIKLGLNTKECSFQLLRNFDGEIKDKNSEAFNRIQNSDYSNLLDSDDFFYDFLKTILEAYSPDMLGIKPSTPATFRHSGDQEVWFDTGAIIIPFKEWEEMRKILKANNDIRNWKELSEKMAAQNEI